MANAYSDNLGLVLQVTGENSGIWGSTLNTSDITVTDSALGKTLSVALASSNVALTTTQRQNLAFALSGVISANITITFPLNFNSLTVACGGFFIFDNQTTGAFTVTVKTVAVGSTGVAVPQGLRAILYSNGTNIYYANDGGKGSAFSVNTYAGNPNGVVTCVPGSATTPADMLFDRTNNILYACTAAPNTWSQAVPTPTASTVPVATDGLLTLSSSANNVILTNDSVAATTLYYTPFVGSLISIPGGATYTTYTFSQLSLALSATYQAANGLYDVFAFVNSGSAAIGFGPIWTTGGGSVTAGTCARGTGASSTQIERLGGLWTNTVSITLNNGETTYSVGARSATYLGSVFIDSTVGQVTCHTSYGQSRKWGVWNAYNRVPILLQGGDPTASWTYSSMTVRPSNGSSANNFTFFCGLAEEQLQAKFLQLTQPNTVGGTVANGIGLNSTTVMSGTLGTNSDITDYRAHTTPAEYNITARLGINVVTSLETNLDAGGTAAIFYGTVTNMVLTGAWRG